ncbi:MAG TPA: hypothetical protein VGM92_15480 [Candidatus Kapabacteria bacterium]|jgi:hypothetical protein
MRIHKIILDHIGHVEHEEIAPADVTIFEGPNGCGKSLHLKALRAALATPKRGHDYTELLSDEAPNGYIALSLNAGLNIRRDINSIESKLSIKSKALGEQRGSDANRYVTNTFDAESINCESFLTKDKKERQRLILEAIPFEMDRIGLRSIVGNDFDKLQGHPLEILDHVHKTFYDRRAEINRSAKERRQMAQGLADTIQSEVDLKQVDSDISRLESELQDLQQARNEKIESAEIKASREITTASKEHADTITSLRNEAQEKINLINEGLTRLVANLDKIFQETKDSNRSLIEQMRSEADAEFLDKSTGINLAIQGARSQRDIEIATEAQRKIIREGLRSAAEMEAQSTELSETLTALDFFKSNMLKELPIPGITMQDGEIIIDGKAWDKVPDSRLVTLAIDLAIARSQESSILIADKAEAIDNNQFENIIIPHLLHSGRQCFIGRANVGSHTHPIVELKIRTLSREQVA